MGRQTETGMLFGLSGSGAGFESIAPEQWPTLARQAEQMGFQSLWVNEEHFQARQKRVGGRYILSPLVAAGAIAAATEHIRLGFSVLLLPLHQPIRLAEELASLDCLSRGRVDFGVSRGGSPSYMAAFQVSGEVAREGFTHDLQIVLDSWSPNPISIAGHSYDVQPKPVQRPHPPIYIGTYSEDLAQWSAANGHRLIIHGIQSETHARTNLRWFVDAGGDPASVPFGRFTYVAESDVAARRDLMPTLVKLTQRLRAIALSGRGILDEADLEPTRFFDRMVIAGSAANCIARIAELRDTLGIRHFNLLPAFFGYLPPRALRQSLRRFATEVMPVLGQAR